MGGHQLRISRGPLLQWSRRRRVVSAGMKRVALTQAFRGKQGPAQRAVIPETRDRIMRARRLEPTDRSHRVKDQLGEGELIDAYERDEDSREHAMAPPDRPALCDPGWSGARSPRSFLQNLIRAASEERRDAGDLVDHGVERQVRSARLRDDHQIDPRRKQLVSKAKRLSEQPLRSIAHHRAPGLLRGDDAEPTRQPSGARRSAFTGRLRVRTSREQHHEMRGRHSGARARRRRVANRRVRTLLHAQEVLSLEDATALRITSAPFFIGSARGGGLAGRQPTSGRSSSPGACGPCDGGR